MMHIESPRTGDQAIEADIRAKGKTAPRITPADIEANIASEHYFTAAEGVIGMFAAGELRRLGGEATLRSDIAHPDILKQSLNLLTFCVLVLRNGRRLPFGHVRASGSRRWDGQHRRW